MEQFESQTRYGSYCTVSLWGPLASRFEAKMPRRILSLDGGGYRGLISLYVLKEIERQLRDKIGLPELKLCDFFDYIGGTSTGAIIAAALARGMTVDEVLNFYHESGPDMFQLQNLYRRLNSFYRDEPLAKKLQNTLGHRTCLIPQDLRCLLLVVTKNATTDSPWPISSNPKAKYNDPARKDCNLKIPLWQLVRASTAAPFFFPPETIQWDPGEQKRTFVFVDGGMTPYNNPAFLLYRMATLPQYNLGWETGEDNLMIISVGTGILPSGLVGANPIDRAKNTIDTLMFNCNVEQDICCRMVGRCVHGSVIDRELGDMIGPGGTGKQFLYARYNLELTRNGLDTLGLPASLDPLWIQSLDCVDRQRELAEVGEKLAQTVDISPFEHFWAERSYRDWLASR